MYAYFKKLDYFSTECIYSPNAYRGHARAFIKDAEKIRPTAIIDIISSGESLSIKRDVKMPVQGTCSKCGYVSSQRLCKACLLLEGLNKGLPKLGIGKSDKIRRRAGLESSSDTPQTGKQCDGMKSEIGNSGDISSLDSSSNCKANVTSDCCQESAKDCSGKCQKNRTFNRPIDTLDF